MSRGTTGSGNDRQGRSEVTKRRYQEPLSLDKGKKKGGGETRVKAFNEWTHVDLRAATRTTDDASERGEKRKVRTYGSTVAIVRSQTKAGAGDVEKLGWRKLHEYCQKHRYFGLSGPNNMAAAILMRTVPVTPSLDISRQAARHRERGGYPIIGRAANVGEIGAKHMSDVPSIFCTSVAEEKKDDGKKNQIRIGSNLGTGPDSQKDGRLGLSDHGHAGGASIRLSTPSVMGL